MAVMNSKDFVAIDFETATANRNSACQIGIVSVKDGKVYETKDYLIQPPGNLYDYRNSLIHRITSEKTFNSPTFNHIWPSIWKYLENSLIVCHNSAFDIDVLNQSLNYYGIEVPVIQSCCTYQIFGMSLDEIVQAYDIELNHHDALSDALACARIYLMHLNGVQPDLNKIKIKKSHGIFESPGHERIKGQVLKPDFENGDEDSYFFRKKIVITGCFNNISRTDLAKSLHENGADIDTTITRKTNIVIVGEAPGPAKMKKVKKLKQDGYDVEIIDEDQVLSLLHA